MRLFILASSLALAALPALAAETPWVQAAPDVRLRLISTGKIAPDKTALIGLEIDMPQTIKTYWRVPGDTGFPAVLDFSGSRGVVAQEILWPYPTREQTPDYLDHVYFGPVVLPLELKLDSTAPHIELDAILGICSEICVPARLAFSFDPLEDGPDPVNGLRLRQALATVPLAWTGERQPIGEVKLLAGVDTLAVELDGPEVDPGSIIAATADASLLFGAPQKSPEPDIVLIPVLGGNGTIGLEGRDVILTFLSSGEAFEVTRTVEPALEQ